MAKNVSMKKKSTRLKWLNEPDIDDDDDDSENLINYDTQQSILNSINKQIC